MAGRAPGAVAAVLAQADAENFFVASRFLPHDVRQDLLSIYGFARCVDDAGDEGTSGPRERLALLDHLEEELDLAYRGHPGHPIFVRLARTIHRRALPDEPFRALIEANRRDQLVARYPAFQDLLAYCELSANPVGRLVLHVLGAATQERVAMSDAVCTGLQLVEHWQDVGEDLGRGRIYLPLEDLRRFGVTEPELAGPRSTSRVRRLMAFEVERARGFLDRGAPLAATLPWRAGVAVAGFVGGGRAALRAIEREGFDVLGSQPRPARSRRVAAIAREVAGMTLTRGMRVRRGVPARSRAEAPW